MIARRPPRWALSFADLCLLLLGFFVMLQAQGGAARRMTDSVRAALGHAPALGVELRAAALFEPGEAVLRPEGRQRLAALAGRALRVESRGIEPGTRRFDGWELAAARTAVVARTLAAGDPARVDVAVMDSDPGGQRITLLPR